MTQYCQIIAECVTEWALNDKYTVYKSTDIFKPWTDRQMASRRHVFFEGLAHNLGLHHHPNPHSQKRIGEYKKNERNRRAMGQGRVRSSVLVLFRCDVDLLIN